MLLSLRGHQVEIARSAPEGLKIALDVRLEIILRDLGRPSINGYEVASRLRATEGFEDVLILAIPGYGMASDRELSIADGIDYHLLKPVPLEELESVIDNGTSPPERPDR
jgi:two-component system CheB/CheR fusion protein